MIQVPVHLKGEIASIVVQILGLRKDHVTLMLDSIIHRCLFV